MFYTKWVWVLKRLLYTDLYRTAHTHLCVIMRQTINFQVHLLRFCPESREGAMYYRLAGQRIQLERYGQRGICVYTLTYTHTHTAHALANWRWVQIFIFIFWENVFWIFLCFEGGSYMLRLNILSPTIQACI